MPASLSSSVLVTSDDLPIRTARPVHSGKVRSVYWLEPGDSKRLIAERGYPVHGDSQLALMVISDRVSAFDCLWHSEQLPGAPGKGAALNAIAARGFAELGRGDLLPHHLLEMPHPMLWVVRQARPIAIEAIVRQYLTGSLWRAYSRGERQFAGEVLQDGLRRYARLPGLLFTPSTKGIQRGLSGVPEYDDAAVDPQQLMRHWQAFGFASVEDVDRCRNLLLRGFERLASMYAHGGDLLVDTKFEFGYAPGRDGADELLVMDEVGTPDSSRVWRQEDWEAGTPVEYSKELFREALLEWVPDPDLLLDSERMAERLAFAREHRVPDAAFEALSSRYLHSAEKITGARLALSEDPRGEILDILSGHFALLR